VELSLHEIVQELERRKTEGGWMYRFFNTPHTRREYSKHWEYFDAGATHGTRLFTAGNQVGA
jgi:hypothetical protein